MLRVILRRRHKDRCTGLESAGYQTVDIDVPEIEEILRGGGVAEDGYDVRELAGIEILPIEMEGNHGD